MSGAIDHLPPQDTNAEEAVLGSCLVDTDAVAKARALITPEQFYRDRNGQIFAAVLALDNRREPIDWTLLTAELQGRGIYEEIGGLAYLSHLAGVVPTAVHVEHYAGIVRECAMARRLISACGRIAAAAYDREKGVDAALGLALSELAKLQMETAGQSTHSPEQRAALLADILMALDRGEPPGLRTGLDVDRCIRGLRKGALYIIGARTGVGKSAWMQTVARNLALREHRVLFASAEMSDEELIKRDVGAFTGRDWNETEADLLRRPIPLGVRESVGGAIGRLSDLPLHVYHAGNMTTERVRREALRMQAEGGLACLFVDYLQRLADAPENRNGTRNDQVQMITGRLKAMAMDLGVPVVTAAQLSRGVDARPAQDRRPRLSDFRECVTGDTLVLLADGRRTAVKELVGTAPEVLAATETGRIVAVSSDKVWCVGERPILRLTLTSGRIIRATVNHRLRGARGWVQVAELKKGDRIALARQIPEPPHPLNWSDDQVVLLAHLIGDGSYEKGSSARYTTGSEENSSLVTMAARRGFGAKVTRYPGRGNYHQLLISNGGNRWQANGVLKWLETIGVRGERSHEKRLPRDAFSLSNRQTALLLAHLWATDGSISWDQSKRLPRVYFATASDGLSRDVAALLLRFGIVARIRHVRKAGYSDTHTVDITGLDQLRPFSTHIGAVGAREQAGRELALAIANGKSNPNVDTLPHEAFDDVRARMKTLGVTGRAMAAARGTTYGGSSHFGFAPSRATVRSYAALLGGDLLDRWAMDRFFWDSVASIEDAGYTEVYDLTVPGLASWLADGIVSHNSGGIEQDADVALGLYRPSYYDEQANCQDAELLVLKNRGGRADVHFPMRWLAERCEYVNCTRPGEEMAW